MASNAVTTVIVFVLVVTCSGIFSAKQIGSAFPPKTKRQPTLPPSDDSAALNPCLGAAK
jgi:hypothetical protein